jgi:hypothetical protein
VPVIPKVGDCIVLIPNPDPDTPWLTPEDVELEVTHEFGDARVLQVQRDEEVGVIVVRPDGSWWWLNELERRDADQEGVD